MRSVFVLLMLSILLTGSVIQVYNQKTDWAGNAIVEEKRFLTIFLDLFPPGSIEKITQACDADNSLGCSVNGTAITMQVELKPADDYYTYETEYGFPFTTTTLTLYKLPTDRFDTLFNAVLVKAGLSEGGSSAAPLDLREDNRAVAAAYRQMGLESTYSIEMASGISSAAAGNASANITENTASFDLVAVLQDTKPITIKTQQLNLGYFALAAGAILVIAMAYLFFGKKRKKRR